MSDMILPLADPTLASGNVSSLSMKMGTGGNIDKTAHDFEAMFATQLLQPMFDGVAVDPTFGGGHGEEVMRSFLLQEYGKIIANGDRLGIAHKVKEEMLRAQETAKTSGISSPRSAKNAYVSAASANLTREGSIHASVQ